MAQPVPGDEITFVIPTRTGSTRRLRGIYLHDFKDGTLTVWVPDTRRSGARFTSVKPEWVKTIHRKAILPKPTKLLERGAWC